MNIYLAECFKNYCNEWLKELINSCYIRIDNICVNFQENKDEFVVCEIFTPIFIFNQVKMYETTLMMIGDLLGIDFLHIIAIEKIHLVRLKRQARMINDFESWRTYLEFQYLF